jgi:hypothetical protein
MTYEEIKKRHPSLFPSKWYVIATDTLIAQSLSRIRLELFPNCTSPKITLNPKNALLSQHITDNSNIYARVMEYALSDYKDYERIGYSDFVNRLEKAKLEPKVITVDTKIEDIDLDNEKETIKWLKLKYPVGTKFRSAYDNSFIGVINSIDGFIKKGDKSYSNNKIILANGEPGILFLISKNYLTGGIKLAEIISDTSDVIKKPAKTGDWTFSSSPELRDRFIRVLKEAGVDIGGISCFNTGYYHCESGKLLYSTDYTHVNRTREGYRKANATIDQLETMYGIINHPSPNKPPRVGSVYMCSYSKNVYGYYHGILNDMHLFEVLSKDKRDGADIRPSGIKPVDSNKYWHTSGVLANFDLTKEYQLLDVLNILNPVVEPKTNPIATAKLTYIPQKGDLITITKSDRCWAYDMDRFVGKSFIVKSVSSVADNDYEIKFDGDEVWSWRRDWGHFRLATDDEIHNYHKERNVEVVEPLPTAEKEYKVGDWVILKKASHWNSKGDMDHYDGKCVQITEIDNNTYHYKSFKFKGSETWTFYINCIDRLAEPKEIAYYIQAPSTTISNEPKFGMFQTVKLIGNFLRSRNSIGAIGTITEVIKGNPNSYKVSVNGKADFANYSNEDDLVLISDIPTQPPTNNIGEGKSSDVELEMISVNKVKTFDRK